MRAFNLWCVSFAAVVAIATAKPTSATTTIRVPQDQPTIQAAVNAAATSGDTIAVAPGTYGENVTVNGKSLTIKSTGGAAVTMLKPQDTRSITNVGTSTVTVDGFTFSRIELPPVGQGGGIGVNGTSMIVSNCTFSDCRSFSAGGAVSVGSGLSATFWRCTFSSNRANSNGAAIDMASASVVRCESCVFLNNTAATSGGAIKNSTGALTVANSLFASNTSPSGAAVATAASARFTGCTFAGNNGTAGRAILSTGGTTTVENCISWANLGPGADFDASGGTFAVTYSDTQFATTGLGNLNSDPLFVSSGTGDYHLLASSPCIDAGNNSASFAFQPFDADGHLRYTDAPATADTGVPTWIGFGIADIGAFEYLPPAPCAADYNHSGGLEVQDIFDFLNGWFAGCP